MAVELPRVVTIRPHDEPGILDAQCYAAWCVVGLLHLVAQLRWDAGPNRAAARRRREVAVAGAEGHKTHASRVGYRPSPSRQIGIVDVEEVLGIDCEWWVPSQRPVGKAGSLARAGNGYSHIFSSPCSTLHPKYHTGSGELI